ncbi:transporter substrate-binding domain-containing protein [Alloiococcus sp. CFN-8]|uniref:transporter substrate-binding domain-containing protein n=1 Tax=Alloiococcus sp. CFN-8 TaxID=3416081 RepID=UPI003CEAD4B9
MKNNKPKALILLFLCALLLFTSCSKESKKMDNVKASEANDTLIVGMYLSYPPFETINAQGEAEGLSVALAEELGHYLNRDIEIINIPYDNLVSSIIDGKADVIISSLPVTQERLALVDFSDAYANVKYSALLNQELSINNLDELDNSNYTIAVKKDSMGGSYASQKLKKAKIVVYDTDKEAAEAVVNSKADAYIQDELTVFKYWKLYPVATHISFIFEDYAQSWGIAISKSNPELKNKINEFLKEFKNNRGFQKLSESYLSTETDSYKSQNIPFIFD